jgi:uncharacterized repeat protein (TIGR01451 family)
MQKYYYIVRLFITFAAVCLISIANAQHYTNGNEKPTDKFCDNTQDDGVIKTIYIGGNDLAAGDFCVLGIITGYTQSQSLYACNAKADGKLTVSLNGAPGEYSFWWPSLETKGILKDDHTKWPKVPFDGSTPVVVGAGTDGGFAVSDDKLHVYSPALGQRDSIAIAINQLLPVTFGSIETNSSTFCAGGTPTITISELSAPTEGSGTYKYSWLRNGSEIQGAEDSTYLPTEENTAGTYTYTRKVKDERCADWTISSGAYTLIVLDDPVPTIERKNNNPGDTTICYNTSSGTLSAIVAGGIPAKTYNYTWETSIDQIAWSEVSGHTASTYAPGAATTTTYYRVSVAETVPTYGCASTVTPQQIVTTTVLPVFTAGTITAATFTVCEGGAPIKIESITPASGGNSVIEYQWYRNGNLITGATSEDYTPPGSDALQAGAVTYTREAKDTLCNKGFTLSSGTYVLEVVADPVVTIAPLTESICYDTQASTLTANPTGGVGTPTTYEWEKNDSGTWVTISNVTTDSYDPGTLTTTTQFRVQVTQTGSGCVSPWSTPSTITVHPEFNSGAIVPVDTMVCKNGTPGTIRNQTAAQGGFGTTIYQWRKNGNEILGATDASYPIPSTDVMAAGTTTYTRFVKDATCTNFIQSGGEYVLTVVETFDPGTIPTITADTICVGGTPISIPNVTSPSGGDGTFIYQWVVEDANNNKTVINSNTDSYTPESQYINAPGTYTFYREAKDQGTCASSFMRSGGNHIVYVFAIPSVEITPATQTVCHGHQATFTVNLTDGTGRPATYTWEMKPAGGNWTSIPPETTTTYTSGNLQGAATFRVSATQAASNCSSSVSSEVQVTINQEIPTYTCPSDTAISADPIVCNVLISSGLEGTYTATCPIDSLYYTISGATTFTGPKSNKLNPLTSHTFNKGVSTVTYYVKNAIGLSTTCSFTVTVTDDVTPTMTCIKRDTLYLRSGCSYIVNESVDKLTPEGLDMTCSGNYTLLHNYKGGAASLDGMELPLGTTHVTWTLTDKFGNETKYVDTLVVVDIIHPTFINNDITWPTVGLPVGECEVNVTWDEPQWDDNCSGVTLHRTDTLDHTPSLMLKAGNYVIKYVAIDAAGNESSDTCKVYITVIDDNMPEIVCPADSTLKVDNSTVCHATIPVGALRPVISEICADIATLEYTLAGATVAGPQVTTSGLDNVRVNVGETNVVYTITTNQGKTAHCSFNIIVQDTVKPVITVKPSIVLNLDNQGSTVLSIDDILLTWNDNCTDSTSMRNNDLVSLSRNTFSCADAGGTFTVIVSTADLAGNESSVSLDVMVFDTLAPIIHARDITVQLDGAGIGSFTPGEVVTSLIDNCTAADYMMDNGLVTLSQSSFTCATIGTPNVVYVYAEDEWGNKDSVAIHVTVEDKIRGVDLGITLTSSITETFVSDTIVYALMVKNYSDCATIAEVDFALPKEVRYLSHKGDAGTGPYDPRIGKWDLGVINGNDLKVLTVKCVVEKRSTAISATACVTSTIIDNEQGNNCAAVDVRYIKRDTKIEKYIHGRDVANVGDIVEYRIKITNITDGDENLSVIDSLPAGMTVVNVPNSDKFELDATGRVVIFHVGDLAEHASVEYALTVKVTTQGLHVNRAFLNRAGVEISRAEAPALNALQSDVAIMATIREGDYHSITSGNIYNVQDDYSMVVTAENLGGGTINRVAVTISYDPLGQNMINWIASTGSIIDDGNGTIIWEIQHLDGNFVAQKLEIKFEPLTAGTYTYTLSASVSDVLPGEDETNNRMEIYVNQSILKIPNVVTAENPVLRIKSLEDKQIIKASMRVLNIRGNQVYYAEDYKTTSESALFTGANLSRGTYWYELEVYYESGKKVIVRDFVEVLK